MTLSTAMAQVVQEGLKTMSKGDQNCFYLELPPNHEKLAAEVWKDFMKEYKGKTKFNKKTKEFFTDNTTISGMSDNTVDVYARVDIDEITVWYDLGGAYLTSYTHSDRYPAVEKMLSAYYLNFSREVAKENVKQKEDELKGLEKEQKKLENDNSNLNETIKKAKEAIAKAEQEIEANLKMQEAKKQAIKDKLSEVQDAKKNLDNLGKKN